MKIPSFLLQGTQSPGGQRDNWEELTPSHTFPAPKRVAPKATIYFRPSTFYFFNTASAQSFCSSGFPSWGLPRAAGISLAVQTQFPALCVDLPQFLGLKTTGFTFPKHFVIFFLGFLHHVRLVSPTSFSLGCPEACGSRLLFSLYFFPLKQIPFLSCRS